MDIGFSKGLFMGRGEIRAIVHRLGGTIVKQATADEWMAEEMSAILAEMTDFGLQRHGFLHGVFPEQVEGTPTAGGCGSFSIGRRGFPNRSSAEGADQPFAEEGPTVHHSLHLGDGFAPAM